MCNPSSNLYYKRRAVKQLLLLLLLPSLKHMPTVPIVGMGKEGHTLICPWGYLNRKLPFMIELPGELLALCQFSVVNAIDNANDPIN